jgi:hypothetical protein
MAEKLVERLVRDMGGTIKEIHRLPDGSGFAIAELPLPDDHWLRVERDGYEAPPMPLRMGTDHPLREDLCAAIWQAGKYALRVSTMNGKEEYDPDAVIQNLVVGLLGYHTPSGLSDDEWANPREDGCT